MIPSAGFLVMTTSQKVRPLCTPWPRTCGQVIFATSVRAAAAGVDAVPRRAWARVTGAARTTTASAISPAWRSVIDAYQAAGIGTGGRHRGSQLDQFEEFHARARVVAE